MTFPSVMRRPTAILPIAMSLAAFALVLVRVAALGTSPDKDEGAVAHIFQLLVGAQVPLIAFFALKWFLRAPRISLMVLVGQAAALLVALAPVYFFGL